MTAEELAELERLSAAVREARVRRDAVPVFVTAPDGTRCVNTGDEVWKADAALDEADAAFALALREGGHALVAEVRRLRARVAELETGCTRQNDTVCQVLGGVLGFPRYADDRENFPDAKPEDGVCVGELVAEDLARLAEKRIAELGAALTKALPFVTPAVPQLLKGWSGEASSSDIAAIQTIRDLHAELAAALKGGKVVTFKDWWEKHRGEFDPRAETVFADLWRVARAELEARVAELESGTVPGLFYTCGCPAKRSTNIKAFCAEHYKSLSTPTGETP